MLHKDGSCAYTMLYKYGSCAYTMSYKDGSCAYAISYTIAALFMCWLIWMYFTKENIFEMRLARKSDFVACIQKRYKHACAFVVCFLISKIAKLAINKHSIFWLVSAAGLEITRLNHARKLLWHWVPNNRLHKVYLSGTIHLSGLHDTGICTRLYHQHTLNLLDSRCCHIHQCLYCNQIPNILQWENNISMLHYSMIWHIVQRSREIYNSLA